MVAARHAARHLKIDKAVMNGLRRTTSPMMICSAEREAASLSAVRQRAVKAVEMPRHVHDIATRYLAYLIDAVGELIAAVLDMDLASVWAT